MAEKGKIVIIKDDSGGIILDNGGNEIPFYQRYIKELNLNIGDQVSFERRNIAAGNQIANLVKRISAGTIARINDDNSTGIITERETNKQVPFYQANLTELKLGVGDLVNYDLVCSLNGAEIGVNVDSIFGR